MANRTHKPSDKDPDYWIIGTFFPFLLFCFAVLLLLRSAMGSSQ